MVKLIDCTLALLALKLQ